MGLKFEVDLFQVRQMLYHIFNYVMRMHSLAHHTNYSSENKDCLNMIEIIFNYNLLNYLEP